ncbi:MAG: DUF3467 domain-containing protein [Pirellula sp.]
MPYPSPDDRPDPNDGMPAMRARIPDHVAKGEISTGVIVVTGATEYVLDFVRNLPRPNAIVARVVMPHMVMPQFIEALAANIELFRQRYGELPGAPQVPVVQQFFSPGPGAPPTPPQNQSSDLGFMNESKPAESTFPPQPPRQAQPNEAPESMDAAAIPQPQNPSSVPAGTNAPQQAAPSNQNPPKRQNPQEVYDDLKLRDEILSGSYANAVMIGHGPFEFSFDFITNFYPQSAVSCRVFLASGHIYRLLESLRASWEQLRPRLTQSFPPNQPPPPPPRNVE